MRMQRAMWTVQSKAVSETCVIASETFVDEVPAPWIE
jgi:hypothetical protein